MRRYFINNNKGIIIKSIVIIWILLLTIISFRFISWEFPQYYSFITAMKKYNFYNNKESISIITLDSIDNSIYYYRNIIILKQNNDVNKKNILEFESRDFVIGTRWRGNDTLDIQVGTVPRPKIIKMVRDVGPIHIKYYFFKPGEKVPVPDIPPTDASCVTTYWNPYWHRVCGGW